MLSLAADFWPVFWTILGTAAVVTVALCLAISVVPMPGTRRHQQPPALLHHRRPARTPRHADGMPHAA